MKWYQRIAAVAMLSIAPVFGMAQGPDSARLQPLFVPYNGASELINNPMSLPMRPQEVGLMSSRGQTDIGTTLFANKTIQLSDAIKLGIAGKASSSLSEGKKTANSGNLLAGAERKIGRAFVGAGASLALAEKGGNAVAGPLSIQARYVVPWVARAGATFAPSKKEGAITADAIVGRLCASATVKLANGKAPAYSVGAEARARNGWQAGISLHPERGFLGGKANPCISIRKAGKQSTFNIAVKPQQKAVSIGVGWRF